VNQPTDSQLLRDYAERQSEPAFAELVRRHTDFVYSAALRMVRDPHLAEDVTQGTFVALAKNGSQLTERPVLSGWLHRTTQNIAAQTVRTIERRRAREQEAAAMNELLAIEGETPWNVIAPLLDAALAELNDADRDAVLLRYFEKKSAPEMAGILGISDEAAQKRVSRAVERLREFFSKRKVAIGASGFVALLSANAVQAAPSGLAVAIAGATTLAGTAVSTSTVITATKAIAMTTLQKTLVTATVAVLAGAGIYEARQTAQLREQNLALRQQQAPLVEQIGRLQTDNAALSNRLARTDRMPSLSSDRLRELLKLRGEVGVLRRQQREREQAAAATLSKTPGLAGQPEATADPQPNQPSPFQVQLVLDEPDVNSESMTNSAGDEAYYVQKAPLMDYAAIRSATVERNASSGAPEINVEFSDVGKELFAAVTKENLNRRLAIVLDGHLYAAPLIRSEITGGKAQITGNFTEEEARALAAKINDAIGGQ
jgi:RNA polymerase sigma factor (sigma-70 family)